MMQHEKIRTLHVYVSEEDAYASFLDAEPAASEPLLGNPWGMAYCWFIGVLFTLLPLVAILAAQLLPASDTVLSKTLTLTLSLHPMADQVPLFALAAVTESSQITVPATGRSEEPATRAMGALTFYNGLFTAQRVPAGITFLGQDGARVVTREAAVIPAALLTTPPTDGTASIAASSALAGASGNIAAQDIHQVCCGGAILVQNLDAFHGGRNAQEVTVVTESDLTNVTTTLQRALEQRAATQARSEVPPGQQLVPLKCTASASSNHQAGDLAQSVQVTVAVHCTPLAYSLAVAQSQATALLTRTLPLTVRLVGVSLLLLSATETDTAKGTGTLTVQITAFVQRIRPVRGSAGKEDQS
jgi:hypothetical protein